MKRADANLKPNLAMERTSGRCTERLKDEFTKDEMKGKLIAVSGGSAPSR